MRTATTAALGVLLIFSFAAGCAKDPSKSVAHAKVEEPKADEPKAAGDEAAEPDEAPKPEEAAKPADPAAAVAKEAPAAAPAAAPAGAIALTGTIEFIGSKVTGSHECIFKEWSGTVSLADGKPEGGSLTFAVKTASVVADHKAPTAWSGKLTGHLKSDDFFDSEKHPDATFVSSSIAAKPGDKGATHEVVGKLTIRGIAKDITFPATISATDKEVSGKAEFSINRKDFSMQYAGKPDDLIRDGVVLKIDLKGARG